MSCNSLLYTALPIPTQKNTTSTKPKPKPFHVSPRMSLQSPPPPNPNILTTITDLLWGKSLPPQLLISTVRSSWHAAWLLMMSQLAPSDPSGRYTRPTSKFRANSKPPQFSLQNSDSTTTLHLYVGLPCPWAHRTLIVRALKGLELAVPVSVASPGADGSWEFRDNGGRDRDGIIPGLDNANRCRNLKEVYRLRRGGYNGRATVPMLWDVERKEVVCNESYDIIELFNLGFNGLARNPDLDLSPPSLKGRIDEWNREIYPNVNNGVYR